MYDESNLDKEITLLFNNAKEQIKKIEENSVNRKKQIILELAKDLEGKIDTNTICIEIKNQLRGEDISEHHIEECLDEKHKQSYRVKNARKQNKSKSQYGSNLVKLEEDLAAPFRLNEEEHLEEEQEEEKEVLIVGSSGHNLIQEGEEEDQSPSANNNNYYVKPERVPTTTKQHDPISYNTNLSDTIETKQPDSELEDDTDKQPISSQDNTRALIKCQECEKKVAAIRTLEDKICELEEVLRKYNPFTTADNLKSDTLN